MVMADLAEETSAIEDDFRSTDVDMDEPLLNENRQRYKKGLGLRFASFHVWCLIIQLVLLCIYIITAVIFAKSWTFYHATSGMWLTAGNLPASKSQRTRLRITSL